ncbi:MAG: hypothetical protein J6A80_07560 [Lachnospiraceae bacterium]|nr:hypothetical protein [Lachnospiraceae bacterium]
MESCNLSTDITNIGIKLKELLKGSNHSEWRDVDYFLCQYDYKNIYDKEELIRSMLGVCHIRAYGDLYVLGIEYIDWINLLGVFAALLRGYQSDLTDEVSKISFDKFTFDGKEFDIKRDVFNWVITDDVIVFLLKENSKEFNDNLVALDRKGNILWSSKEIIDVPNRLGACFVGLHNGINEDGIINAQSYVGINYAIEVNSGKVIRKKTTK